MDIDETLKREFKHYLSDFDDSKVNIFQKKKNVIITSKKGTTICIMTVDDQLIDNLTVLKRYSLITFQRLSSNKGRIYYFNFEGEKINRKQIKNDIKLYREFKLILSTLQKSFYIKYLRDGDFIISKDRTLLFINLDALMPLGRIPLECECKCEYDNDKTLFLDIETFLVSKEKIFVSKYKCIKCSKKYSILDLEGYKSQITNQKEY